MVERHTTPHRELLLIVSRVRAALALAHGGAATRIGVSVNGRITVGVSDGIATTREAFANASVFDARSYTTGNRSREF